jgi:hypothetical protein
VGEPFFSTSSSPVVRMPAVTWLPVFHRAKVTPPERAIAPMAAMTIPLVTFFMLISRQFGWGDAQGVSGED